MDNKVHLCEHYQPKSVFVLEEDPLGAMRWLNLRQNSDSVQDDRAAADTAGSGAGTDAGGDRGHASGADRGEPPVFER